MKAHAIQIGALIADILGRLEPTQGEREGDNHAFAERGDRHVEEPCGSHENAPIDTRPGR